MKHLSIAGFTLLVMCHTTPSVMAQDANKGISETANSINLYVGLFDVNVNYERNIVERSKSLSNLRLGFGYAMLFVAGEGYYVNGVYVHLFGAKKSHLEVNAGAKYMLTNSISDPAFSDQLIPEIYLGYRFEKPTGGIIFRTGLSYPTFVNLGLGYKF